MVTRAQMPAIGVLIFIICVILATAAEDQRSIAHGPLQLCSLPGMAKTGGEYKKRNGFCSANESICVQADFITKNDNWCWVAGGTFNSKENQCEMKCEDGSSTMCPVQHWCLGTRFFFDHADTDWGCDLITVVCNATNLASLKSGVFRYPGYRRSLACLYQQCPEAHLVKEEQPPAINESINASVVKDKYRELHNLKPDKYRLSYGQALTKEKLSPVAKDAAAEEVKDTSSDIISKDAAAEEVKDTSSDIISKDAAAEEVKEATMPRIDGPYRRAVPAGAVVAAVSVAFLVLSTKLSLRRRFDAGEFQPLAG